MDKEVERFEENFQIIRKSVGWSAEEFGNRIGVTRQTINNIENKKYKLTKSLYLLSRYVLEQEIKTHPDETEILKVILDAFVDHPEKYNQKTKDKIYQETCLLTPAIKTKNSNRKEVSKEWKAILVGLSVIASSAIAAIAISSWRKK